MAAGKDPARYSLPSIILHWGMLLVLAAVYASIELREFWPKGPARAGLAKSGCECDAPCALHPDDWNAGRRVDHPER